jgi:hypothetical protein
LFLLLPSAPLIALFAMGGVFPCPIAGRARVHACHIMPSLYVFSFPHTTVIPTGAERSGGTPAFRLCCCLFYAVDCFSPENPSKFPCQDPRLSKIQLTPTLSTSSNIIIVGIVVSLQRV